MVVVAIVAILAAVVIPNWTREGRNKKYDPEISAMFTEISVKEDQYKMEQGNGAYLAAAQCPGAPVPAGADWNAACNSVAGWSSINVNATESKIMCTYEVQAGCAGATCTVAAAPAVPGGFTAAPATLAGAWFFIVATCDMDANGGTMAKFLMSSWDTKQQQQNYGS